MDGEDDLPHDEQVALEDQGVEVGVHGALDRVLDGQEAQVGRPVVDRGQHVGERRQGHQVGRGQVGLAEQRLLGERAGRPEEADPGGWGGGTGHCPGRIGRSWMNPPCASLLEDVRSGELLGRRRRAPAAPAALRRPGLRQGRSPPGAPPGSARGGVRTGEDGRAVRRDRGRVAGRAGGGPGGADPGQRRAGRGGPRTVPRRRAHRHDDRVAALAAPAGTGRDRHRRHRRPAGGRRVRRPPWPPSGSSRRWRPTAAWPACTAWSVWSTSWPAPTRWWSSPAWKAPWPAWSAASPARRLWPCRPASGYGASLEGVTALLAMLASCAAGLVVVGIDNGFGAACAVARILGPAPGSTTSRRQAPCLLGRAFDPPISQSIARRSPGRSTCVRRDRRRR